MNISIRIPSPLRRYTDNQAAVSVSINEPSVSSALQSLLKKHEELGRHLYEEDGKLRSFVNIYLNNEDVRFGDGLDSKLNEGDELSIIPAIAGGVPVTLDNWEIMRYSRHLIMPEVNIDGQQKLKASSVLLIGAGGLGSPSSLYLAAAGIGRMGIVDFDVVEDSNLQRQVLYGTSDIGTPKLEAAEKRLKDLNPRLNVEPYQERLSSENAREIISKYDVVVDGTDNFPTRYLVNDACVLEGKPNVYGSIFRFDGQVSVFNHEGGPCYRCLYSEPPPPGLVPSCAEGGVLGVLPGIVGTIQATEAIKLIVGMGESLSGKLLLIDALSMDFRKLNIKKNPDCKVCSDNPELTELIDYENFCGVAPQAEEDSGKISQITPVELKARMDEGDNLVLLDIREEIETRICQIEGSVHIPMQEIPSRLSELDMHSDLIIYCKSGERSYAVTEFLKKSGFSRVANLYGGTLAWSETVDPSMPKY
ncbi:MAG: molybdopterin-synthase adenylyltransferase MoeB [Candidatus Marinimicrobia bacterium]|nr:molybdopterin-synthase adenylyltransferase MoeB [Candidatus Neomarinimicrobiota bacterium]